MHLTLHRTPVVGANTVLSSTSSMTPPLFSAAELFNLLTSTILSLQKRILLQIPCVNVLSCDINDEISIVRESIDTLNNKHNFMSPANSKLMRKVTHLEKSYENLYNSIIHLEKDILYLAQYGRIECIEILNIPSTVDDDKWEKTVIKILHNIGLDLDSYDIVAVHCLKGKYKDKPNTIVRFLNRKDAVYCHQYHFFLSICYRKLGFKPFIIENLCPKY